MRVLGLDPGSRHTGFGIVDGEGNRYRCVKSGRVAPPGRFDLPHRLHAIAERVGELMNEHAPDCVAVEEAFFHESVRSTLVLGHVRGVLLVAAIARGIPLAEYSPREIKLSVAGNGGASKDQVSFMIRRLLGVTGAMSPDAADALAVAMCHHHRARRQAPARVASAAARTLETLLERRRAR